MALAWRGVWAWVCNMQGEAGEDAAVPCEGGQH